MAPRLLSMYVMSTARARVYEPPLEPEEAVQFYRAALTRLLDVRIPFMVGGGYAFRHYTGIERWTKDLDVFVRPRDAEAILHTLRPLGRDAEILFPHWLGKVYGDDAFIDVVFSSGNGVAVVDDEWLRYAVSGTVLGLPVRICPAEETIWSKAFVAERERYDGADIAHIIEAVGDRLDWARLLRRFGDDWRVLFSHLVLFGYVYPGQRDRVPTWVMGALVGRLWDDRRTRAEDSRTCRGTLLSREQYLPDIQHHGYRDARLEPPARMTPAEVALWTRAIADRDQDHGHSHRRDEADDEDCRRR